MNTAIAMTATTESSWQDICSIDDLVPYAGISALVASEQAALFYVPDATPAIYALDNFCPSAQANVLSRGIVGDLAGELVVASPMYKEHFKLVTGECLEKPLSVKTWDVQVNAGRVMIKKARPV